MRLHINHIAKALNARLVLPSDDCSNRFSIFRMAAVLLILSMQAPSLGAAVLSLAGLASDHELTVVQNQGCVQVILSHSERSVTDAAPHRHNQVEALFISERDHSAEHPDHYLSFAHFDSLAPEAETGKAEQNIQNAANAGLYFYAFTDVKIATSFMWPASPDNLNRSLQPCKNLQGVVMRL
ncbi:MAG: hypothetical protein ACSHYA_09010 [Opitutaceae bacterium]